MYNTFLLTQVYNYRMKNNVLNATKNREILNKDTIFYYMKYTVNYPERCSSQNKNLTKISNRIHNHKFIEA